MILQQHSIVSLTIALHILLSAMILLENVTCFHATNLGCMAPKENIDDALATNEDQLSFVQYQPRGLEFWSCSHFCKLLAENYTGLSGERYCYCGNKIDYYTRRINHTDCSRCSGFNNNDTETCGNRKKMLISLYDTNSGKLLGCLELKKDDASKKAHGIPMRYVYRQEKLTETDCLEYCEILGNTYAAVKDFHCLCTDKLPKKLLPKERCPPRDCSETRTEKAYCGGPDAISVFQGKSDVDDKTRPYTYIGCYEPANTEIFGNTHQLLVLYTFPANKDTCIKKCNETRIEGNYYAAISEGSFCYCGGNYEFTYTKVDDGQCKYPCFFDDDRQTRTHRADIGACGGGHGRITVFKV